MYGLDEKAIKTTFKWTLRIGMCGAILFCSFGAWIFFKATGLILFPNDNWGMLGFKIYCLRQDFTLALDYICGKIWSC
jgi:hypothetical protein